jgi:DNA anti-recombination protein RmuC
MSEKVDQFCDTLRDRLNALDGRLQSVKANLQVLAEEAEAGLRAKLDEARTKLQAQKERIQETRANLKARAQQMVAETREAVSKWKAKGETRRLIARADLAEAYAADAIAHALASIDEAEEAILEALVARIDADAAQ